MTVVPLTPPSRAFPPGWTVTNVCVKGKRLSGCVTDNRTTWIHVDADPADFRQEACVAAWLAYQESAP